MHQTTIFFKSKEHLEYFFYFSPQCIALSSYSLISKILAKKRKKELTTIYS